VPVVRTDEHVGVKSVKSVKATWVPNESCVTSSRLAAALGRRVIFPMCGNQLEPVQDGVKVVGGKGGVLHERS